MSNVIPFIRCPLDFEAVPEIRAQSEEERAERVKTRLRAIAGVLPLSYKFLSLHRDELVELLTKLEVTDGVVSAKLLADYDSALHNARAVVAIINSARLHIAAALSRELFPLETINLPIYEDDGGGGEAA
jgi:hypothetical protein